MIRSVDKLRDYASRNQRVSGWMMALNRIADEIEAEIAERYMELPVDVNNEPVHIGDEMEHRSKHETLDVIAVGNDSFFTGRWADEYVRCVEVSAQWHHVKPRTLEDVLREFAGDYRRAMNAFEEGDEYGPSITELTARCADEIREMMVGDAE